MQALAKRSSTVVVLTDAQEKFAAHYAAFGSAVDAYKHAYNSTTTRRASVQHAAWQTLHNPKVAARITALRNAEAEGELASRQRLIADLEAVVNVRVEELMQLRVIACPQCYPTPDAWELAAAAAIDRGDDPPPADEPNDACPACAGAGRTVVHLTPTASLSAPARRLFKGLELYDTGQVKKVLLHDQAQLRVELHKLKGMHIDRSVSLNLNADLPALPANVSVEDALRMLESIAPAPADDATVVAVQ